MQRIGETQIVKAIRRKTAHVPVRQQQADAEESIRFHPDEIEKGYMAWQLLQCTLPHSNPGNSEPVFIRRSGDLLMTIQPGWNTKKGKSYGYPYGTLPRLLLFWLITEAVKTKSRKLYLGDSLSEFMRKVGLSPATGGGKRGDITRLKDQMLRLFRCKVSFDREGPKRDRWLDMQIAPDADLWWDWDEPEQAALFDSWLKLGETFYQMIYSGRVPIDLRVLRAIRRSPLALDIYTWLCYRVYVINASGRRSDFIPWDDLNMQVGANYANLDEFGRYARKAIRTIAQYWRHKGLKYKFETGGLRLYKSMLSVPTKEKLLLS